MKGRDMDEEEQSLLPAATDNTCVQKPIGRQFSQDDDAYTYKLYTERNDLALLVQDVFSSHSGVFYAAHLVHINALHSYWRGSVVEEEDMRILAQCYLGIDSSCDGEPSALNERFYH